LASRILWCKLQYRREYVIEMAIGPAVTKRVKDEWLQGDAKNATVKIVICNAGLDNGLSQFGTEQLACSQTHYNEEFDIHIEDQTYITLTPSKGGGGKNGEMNTYITRHMKVITSYTCIEKGDQIEWKNWREGFRVNFKKRTQPTRTLYNWWDPL
jgi:hypothetical protein